MTLFTKDDFSKRELCTEELDAIAAGGFLHWIKHEISSAVLWIEGPGAKHLEKVLFPQPGKHL